MRTVHPIFCSIFFPIVFPYFSLFSWYPGAVHAASPEGAGAAGAISVALAIARRGPQGFPHFLLDFG